MTRALKNAVMQQQGFYAEKALQILDQEAAPLVVDRDKLKVRVYLEQFHLIPEMCLPFIPQRHLALIER